MYKRREEVRNPNTVGSMNKSHTVPSMNRSDKKTHSSQEKAEINKRLEELKEKKQLYQCEYCNYYDSYEDVLQHEKTCKSRPKPELDPNTQENAERNHKLKELDPNTPPLIRKVIQMVERANVSNWEKYLYDNTGKIFYWNSKTEESSWDPPAGIPQATSDYDLLSLSGIPVSAKNPKNLRKAYRKLINSVHSDHNNNSRESHVASHLVNDAYARLTKGSQGGGKNRYPSKKSRKKKKKRKSSNKRGLTNKRKSSNKRGLTNKRKSSNKRGLTNKRKSSNKR